MKKILGLTAVSVLVSGFGLLADDTAKGEMKKAGTEVKVAGKATGSAVKDAGKGVAKGSKKVVNKAAGATETGAAKVKDKTSTVK
jgi:hypothetical protein